MHQPKVLAGASLGAITEKYRAWNDAFWQHPDIAMKLHHIEKVLVLDHRDCGAYKTILREDFSKDRKRETEVHADQLLQLQQMIHKKYPQLQTELLLMDLSGRVEVIAPSSG